MSSHTLHHGDCLAVLKTLPSESVDAVVTDPPYGLSNHDAADVAEALRAWLDGKPYSPKGSGFMGKSWDAFVPGPEVWRECLRVLKPGGHLLVFAGTRTQDLMGISVRLAGFDSRDAIRAEGILAWDFGSGFPKSKNVSLSIDKGEGHPNRGRAIPTASIHLPSGKYEEEKLTSNLVSPYEAKTDAAKQWNGWGTALKPSHEPVLMFRKPLIGTVAANVIAHGTGALNIDGCRVGTDSARRNNHGGTGNPEQWRTGNGGDFTRGSDQGRWPPNTVLVHTPDCRQTGTRTVKAPVINRFTDGMKPFGDGAGHPYESVGGGDEEIPVWECSDGCPVKALDEQSGVTKGTGGFTSGKNALGQDSGWNSHENRITPITRHNDEGGASRFFPQFSYAEEAPFLYMAKAGRSERDEGVVGTPAKQMDESRDPDAPGANNPRNRGGRTASNFHPTVKPIELMRWLARLVTQPNGTVLDPFMGSGTTGCAAMYEGFNFIGIEQSDEYLEIARQRIEYHSLKARGGVVSPWENPAPAPAEKPEAKSDPASLEDLFGFGE
jgi:hypothetical protein